MSHLTHRTVITLSIGWLLAVILGAYSWDLFQRLEAARTENGCPPCAVLKCPGAEQHPVDDWVCETEEDWAKALMDCNGKDEALGVYADVIGDQELELELWRQRCDAKKPLDAAKNAKEMNRELREWLTNTAAKRAIERKLEEKP